MAQDGPPVDPAWLRLLHTQGVGAATFNRLLDAFGEPHAFLDAAAEQVRAAGLDPALRQAVPPADDAQVQASLAWAEGTGHHVVTRADPSFPAALAAIPDPPPLLFVVGSLAALHRPQLAVVGSRKASRGGLDNAYEFARHLTGCGLTITSGLALGIDGSAHEGALDAGGPTVAVTATGPDRTYPARHRQLARRITDNGALITELPPGTGVRREQFPRRNRLLSGLTLGVLVVEAGVHSGSLVTARHALDQGREVFAIPGSIHNPMARGCHALIRQGAKLVESAADVFDELPPIAAPETPAQTAAAEGAEPADEALGGEYRELLDALGDDPVAFDALARRTALTPDTLSSMLLILELKGLVVACAGGRYARSR